MKEGSSKFFRIFAHNKYFLAFPIVSKFLAMTLLVGFNVIANDFAECSEGGLGLVPIANCWVKIYKYY